MTLPEPVTVLGNYLTGILYPLTTNEFSLKDFFNRAKRVRAIPSYLQYYKYVSFDVKSLLTNVSIKRTVDITNISRPCNFNKFEKTDFGKTYLREMYQNCLLVQQSFLSWC